MIDQRLLTSVQYALLEPPNGGLSYASGLWTFEEILDALDQGQQRLLKTTHLQVGVAEITTTSGQHRYTLPDDWLATLHVLWGDQQVNGAGSETVTWGSESAEVSWESLSEPIRIREVFRADMHQGDLGLSSWEQTDGTPLAYSDADIPTRTLQLMPAPATDGTLILLYVPLAQAPTGAGEPLQVPDEWCTPVLKYAVLAHALNMVGRAHDPSRAKYCEWRTRLGADVTRLLLDGMG